MKSRSNIKTCLKSAISILFLSLFFLYSVKDYGQAEFTTWGNLTGFRVNDQLMEFNSSLVLVDQSNHKWATRKEGQKTDFHRSGKEKIFSYKMDSISWKETLQSKTSAEASVRIDFSSGTDTVIKGAYFRLKLPKEYGPETIFEISRVSSFGIDSITGNFKDPGYKAPATGIVIRSPSRQLQIKFTKPAELIINAKDSLDPKISLNIGIASGTIPADSVFSNTFTIKASGEIDREPATVKIFPKQQGHQFDGIGGNFRLQNPEVDPKVIDYNLKNLRVAWARVEMPWKSWQPNLDKDPVGEAKKGQLSPKVKAAMELAQRLNQKGIPIIVSAWFAPDWAIVGKRAQGVNLDGSRGNRLDFSKQNAIFKSITSYLTYLKEAYGVEAKMFSFNESDLGIDVRQTPEEQDKIIKELGANFHEARLDTELLLGDTADANGWAFTTIASTDPGAKPYIGGVSFHSWRGWTSENLIKWRDIANRVEEPLFVGEGSIDAGAWRYPEIFEEPAYALEEIGVYLKILNIAEPRGILQWQLTSDYSILSGGGVFGNHDEKLHPTQRFYNLKQLSSTPKGLFAIPAIIDRKDIVIAAFGDKKKDSYVIHMVNKGATRNIELTGLPETISKLQVFITNKDQSFQELKPVKIKEGRLSIELKGASFISLIKE